MDRDTRPFDDRLRREHAALAAATPRGHPGLPDEPARRRWAAVVLNRLLFAHFLQARGLLDGDTDYLRRKLAESRQRGRDRFYSGFLVPLFFAGLARPRHRRTAAIDRLLGSVPYLGSGLFPSQGADVAQAAALSIDDAAFARLFDFFAGYEWRVPTRRGDGGGWDESPAPHGRSVCPEVLGCLCEEAVHQKQHGAYYTGADVAGYIARSTLIPFLLSAAERGCPAAFAPGGPVWRLLRADPDRYLYPTVRKGVDLPLPAEIAAGARDVSQRAVWNRPADHDHALPRETWREHVARRARCLDLRARLAAGEIRSVGDLVARNLDLCRFALDVIDRCETPELTGAFYAALQQVTVLDPTCGAGAFLAAALDILVPLYRACLDRMSRFVVRGSAGVPPASEGGTIVRSILANNLFGVDLMEEAVEACRLRLALKLLAHATGPGEMEALAEIDLNIRAGNALVGCAAWEEVRQTAPQTGSDPAAPAPASHAQRAPAALAEELDRCLAVAFGVDLRQPAAVREWRARHRPFHWPVEFPAVVEKGGFDVILGNPPYLEYRRVQDTYRVPPGRYRSRAVDNLYAFCMERSAQLIRDTGWFGMIVPAGVLGLDAAAPLRDVLLERYRQSFCSTYAIRPAKLFEAVDQRLCIYLGAAGGAADRTVWTTRYHHWHPAERAALFRLLEYAESGLHPRLGRIPQVGSAAAAALLARLEAHSGRTIRSYYDEGGSPFRLHYHRSPRYWIRAMDFEPYFRSPTRARSVHHFRDLHFRDARVGKVVGAVLNSSLFFWWFLTLGNGRNLTGTDIEQFPLGELSPELLQDLPPLFDRLVADYRAHSVVRVRRDCRFQEFRPGRSRPLLDAIDRVLARHYGFTDEELDFLIHYEIKYRIGTAAARHPRQ